MVERKASYPKNKETIESKTFTCPDGLKIYVGNDNARAFLNALTLDPDNAVDSTVLAHKLFCRDIVIGAYSEGLARSRVSATAAYVNRKVLLGTNWSAQNTSPTLTEVNGKKYPTRAAYYLASKIVEKTPEHMPTKPVVCSPITVKITPLDITSLNSDLDAQTPASESQQITIEQFNNLSLEEIHQVIKNLINGLLQKCPDITPYHLNRSIAEALPVRIPSYIRTMAQKALENGNSTGRDVILYLYMKSVISAIDPYLSDDEEENNEITQAALTSVLEALKRPNTKLEFAQYIYQAANSGAADYVAVREGMPNQDLARDNIFLQELEDDYFDAQRPLSGRRLARISQRLAKHTGLKVETIFNYLLVRHMLKNHSVQEEDSMAGNNSTSGQAISFLLREDVDHVLAGLSYREYRCLVLYYGLGETPRTHKEIGSEFGVSKERVRQLINEAIRKLRHPSRKRWLRPYYYE